MKTIFSEVKYAEAKPFIAIELGDGNTCITDIALDSLGRAGIGFKWKEGDVGGNSGIDGVRLDVLDPELIIITSNVKSLEVLLDKVQRAIVHLNRRKKDE